VLTTGMFALVCDYLQMPQRTLLAMHWCFGAALLASTARSLLLAHRALHSGEADALYQYTRRLARRLYFLLYGLAALRLLIYLAERGNAFPYAQPTQATFAPRPLSDFLGYIGFAALAILMIRLFAVVCVPAARTRPQ
jgi:hypothetical protein